MTRPTACLPVRISRAARHASYSSSSGNRLLVRCDLEHGVGGRVDDPLPGLLVLLAVLLDHLGPRGRLVAENAAAGAVHERIDHLVGEAVRIRRERDGGDDAHHLPVTRRRVLALRALEQPARDRRRAGLRRAALERLDVPEPERLEIGQVETPDGASDVPERVRALISPLGSIRQLTRANGIEHDHAGPRHAGSLRTTWKLSSALSSLLFYVLAILSLSAAVTFAVVKISPAKRTPKPDKA